MPTAEQPVVSLPADTDQPARGYGEQPRAEQPQQPAYGEQPHLQQPQMEQPYQTAYGEERPHLQQPQAEQPRAEQPQHPAYSEQAPAGLAGAESGGTAQPGGAPWSSEPKRPAVAPLVPPPAPSRNRVPLLLAGAVAIVLVGGAIGAFLGSQSGDEDTAAVGAPEGEGDQTPTPQSTAAGETETTEGLDTTSTLETLVGSSTPDNPGAALAYLVVSGESAYLRGLYPSQEVLDQLVEGLVGSYGEANVFNEGQVDPRAEFDPDNFPVYLQDYILFDSNSADLSDDFETLLQRGVVYLSENPDATITVVARTDARGDAEENLELSRQRAQAVVDFWVERGVNPAQVAIDPRGEEDAIEDASDDQAALDRRVEMVLSGLGISG